MRRIIVSLVVLVAFAATTFADEAANKAASAAWEKYQAAQKDYSAVQQKALKAYREALQNKVPAAKARAEHTKATTGARAQSTKALEAFGKAFAKSDWDSWSVAKDAALLEAGLRQVSRHLLDEGKLDKALKANRMFVAKFPNSSMAGYTQLSVGDLLVAKGDVSAGRAEYEKIEAANAKIEQENAKIEQENAKIEKEAKDDQIRAAAARKKRSAASKKRSAAGMRSYATQRLTLVGKPAPDIKSKQWIGGEAQSLSDLKGKVVVVDFWATWCGPCRAVMPNFSKLYAEHKKDGLVMMGLTRFYANGYLPSKPEEMMSGGESVRGMDNEQFIAHVTAFRDNTKMSYPFVIGEQKNFTDYKVRGIPTVAVVGIDGKVALLAVGSGSEPIIKAVVMRELKKIKK